MNPMQNQRSNRQKMVLGGLRVVDISMGWAGPLTGMLLADFGAEVIKVESTRRLDWWRGSMISPDPDVRLYEMSANHNGVNRNKHGVTLDLRDPRGIAHLKELLAIADVMVENFAPRVMENFGLTYDVVRAINPSLVMISMPGFGSTGPWRDYVGFGNTIESLSGVAGLTGHADGPPVLQSNAYGDPVSGIGGAIGVLMALVHRRRTGEGQHIEMAHQELVVQHTAQSLIDYVMNGRVQERRGNRHPWMAPHGVFPCDGEDNWIAIAVESDQEWQALWEALSHPEVAADARFEDALSRWHHQDELDGIISDSTAQWEKAELAERLQRAGVAADAVNSAKEVLEDRQVKAQNSFVWIDRKYVGNHLYPSVTAHLSDTPGVIHKAAPCLGEDNAFVLGEVLGLTQEKMNALSKDGVIGYEPEL